jgi:hypothetical protein
MSNRSNAYVISVCALFLILASIPDALAQPGMCPNHYGPYEPNPIGQPYYCENMIAPGTYNINWANGDEDNLDWQFFMTVDMKANTKYIVTYSSNGELSIDESDDSSLTGYTVLCCRNEGPNALVLCLEAV